MNYMTLVPSDATLNMKMRLKAGHDLPLGTIHDSITGTVIPVFQLGSVKVGMVYAYGPDILPGEEHEGLDKLVHSGEMAYLTFMPEADFLSSAYLHFDDLEQTIADICFDVIKATLRATVIITPTGERYYVTACVFNLPEWPEVKKAPKTTTEELKLWTWKSVAYYYGYMEPHVSGTATMRALETAHQCFVGWAVVYHLKHGPLTTMIPADTSFNDMLQGWMTSTRK
jgi:hypothetical protein